MSIDWSKLSPAPWVVLTDADGCQRYIPRRKGGPMLLPEIDGFPEDETALEFAALALRNAFDVMMRRRWWAVPCSGGVWKVETVCDEDDASLADRFWPDPFTALVEADRLLPAGEAK